MLPPAVEFSFIIICLPPFTLPPPISPSGNHHSIVCIYEFVTVFFFVSLLSLQHYLPIAKTWKQDKCPLRDDWLKEMWYIYIMQYYSFINR